MFQPKYLKQAKLLKKGVKKFLHYKEDLIPAEKMEAIKEKLADFEQAVAGREKESIKLSAKTLTKACERAVPPASNPGLRENLEVIFVAIIIAVGIRAYFLQPFRIPTGSMQPTLNGVIGVAHDPAEDGPFEPPGALRKAIDKVTQGRTYVDFTIPAGARIESIDEATRFKFFYTTTINFDDPGTPSIKVGVPKNGLMNVLDDLKIKFEHGFRNDGSPVLTGGVRGHREIERDLRVSGHVDTGDQVLVNKFSYHFRRPERGEVFVFSTSGIAGIRNPDPRQSRRHSQHYIKRLTGLPGDKLSIARSGGELFVDGQAAAEPMIRRVWEAVDLGYEGYQFVPPVQLATREWDAGLDANGWTYALGPRRYMAMGDNSGNSSDSRMWGPVPERNLVGPALMVYWPFEHWGTIR